MDAAFIQPLGFVAGALTTFAFAPQVLHTWRSGGKDLSWSMLAMFGFGVGLWLAYGFLLGNLPILVANALTIVQILAIAIIKRSRGSVVPARPEVDGD